MKDKEFKNYNHRCNGFSIHARGKQIETKYNPDAVLVKGNKYLIIEHESQPNRKTIVADILKAAHFLQGERSGELVVVLSPKGKSSFKSYPKHVLSYFNWLKERTNLKNVYFVSFKDYMDGNMPIEIHSDVFLKVATSLNGIKS